MRRSTVTDPGRGLRRYPLVWGLLFLALASWSGNEVRRSRREHELGLPVDLHGELPPEVAVGQVALGGFRGLAVDILWARATRLQEEGRYFEQMQLANWITRLQPGFTQVWVYQAWNLSYNLAAAAETPREKWMWVRAGLTLLRDAILHRLKVQG